MYTLTNYKDIHTCIHIIVYVIATYCSIWARLLMCFTLLASINGRRIIQHWILSNKINIQTNKQTNAHMHAHTYTNPPTHPGYYQACLKM